MNPVSVVPYRAPPAPAETTRLQQTSLRSVEAVDVSFTDASGRSYHLSVERQTSFGALTYDRTARVGPGTSGSAPRGSARYEKTVREGLEGVKEDLKELRSDLRDLRRELARGGSKDAAKVLHKIDHAFREMRDEVHAFQKMLHRFLKNADSGYAARHPETGPGGATFGEEYARSVSVSQSVTVTLEVSGGVAADEWTVEKTAGRLVDFAVGLFRGGDSEAHADRMAGAMEAGYREAEAAFGGALPDIARETVDLAKDLLADWARPEEPAAPAPAQQGFELVA